MRKLLLFLFMFPFTLFAATKVGIIGDSISVETGVSYVDFLKERLAAEGKQVEIINRSFSGAKSDTAMQIAVGLITKERPDYILIFLGINDAGCNTSQDILQHNFEEAFSKIGTNCKKVILGGVNCERVNSSYNIILVQTYLHLIERYHPHAVVLLPEEVLPYTIDGIHPNPIGARMIANNLYYALQEVGVF
ncbi:SGNH/GDSL hydrolase family protein [Candidatus Protochlamydia phocaeensis]|uniref:SGNH/GDSL hydrolase family protein n=1 Tax=Candidatus Protochlamydia phocaeensis TaxID=1414722 RepID=UPI000839033F|nr:SGNH/GDSL hydrolase family protein [Candidatus Protochlamydia phocaeensis]